MTHGLNLFREAEIIQVNMLKSTEKCIINLYHVWGTFPTYLDVLEKYK